MNLEFSAKPMNLMLGTGLSPNSNWEKLYEACEGGGWNGKTSSYLIATGVAEVIFPS